MAKILPIAQLGTPVTREIAQVVTDIDSEETQDLVDDLMLTCDDADGMGITAPQVYRSYRILSCPRSQMSGTLMHQNGTHCHHQPGNHMALQRDGE